MTGRTFRLEAQYDADGCTQIQTYTVTLERTPTLAGLTVTANGVVQPLDFDPDTASYTLSVISDTVDVAASPFGADYTVTGTGTVELTASRQTHTVSVTAEGRTTDYILHLQRMEAAEVTAAAPAGGAEVRVTNAAGGEITPQNGVYRLVPGAVYTCTAVDGDCRASLSFTAVDGLHLTAPAPETADALTALALYSGSSAASRQTYESAEGFSPHRRSLTYTIPDDRQYLYAQATALSGYTVQALYARQTANAETDGRSHAVTVKRPVSSTGAADMLAYCSIPPSGRPASADATLRTSNAA